MKKVIIIGSGIAGLASALRMRKRGFDVLVFERNSYPGGKIYNLESKGYRFDTGPSLFTLPHLVDELFQLYGENPANHFKYSQKNTICNYFWSDGTQFSALADTDNFISEAVKTFNVKKESLEKYLNSNREKYKLTEGIFLKKSLHKASTYLSFQTLKALLQTYKLDIDKSLNNVNEQTFQDPRLVQLFNRYATYNGSSPYKTPGIMSMIPHLEMDLGTYLPIGGMQAISSSLYKFAVDKGVKFHFSESVKKITTQKNGVTGVVTEKDVYKADLVISNADVFTSYKRLLKEHMPPNKILSQERSSSALIFYWGIKKEFPNLDLHNILFSENYKEEFEHIFQQKTIYKDPTVYINITSKYEPNDAPNGSENWFVMINTPGNFNQNWEVLIAKARKCIIEKINNILNTNIEALIESEHVLDPRTIESKTQSHRGSLYGASSNSKFAAFLRHPNFTSKLRGLYFCGGSVHPGGGIPLCLLSAKIVDELIP